MIDEHILQYNPSGNHGECELVIGLDFGTSASKVVVQAPELPGSLAYAVDFSGCLNGHSNCLMPTRLWITDDGKCSLEERNGSKLVNDIKLELLVKKEHKKSNQGPTARDLNPETAAVAYLALLLRYTRKWFLMNKKELISHFRKLIWSLNLGVPSPCIENNDENQSFQRVGKAAWMLSVFHEDITIKRATKEIRLLIDTPEYWEEDIDGLSCDFEIIPEIAAGAVGYALSNLRREGVHLMVDVGAFTMDACGFLLHHRGGDRYSLLTADVKQLGTIILHHQRISAVQSLYDKQARDLRDKHDPMEPITEDLKPYLMPRDKIISCIQSAEEDMKKNCLNTLRKIICDLKVRRAPNEDVWKKKFPILLIGGGIKLPFFISLIDEFKEWIKTYSGNEGATVLDAPIPETLNTKDGQYERLAVAWGLSHRALDVGEIIPADQIDDIDPPKLIDWRGQHIGKELV